MYEPVPELPYLPAPRQVLPLERLGALVEVIICSGYPSQILLILVLRGFGMRTWTEAGRLSPPFVFTVSLIDAALVVSLVLVFLRAHRQSARAVLLGTRPVVREALLGLAVLPAVFMLAMLVLVLILRFAPHLHDVAHNPLEDMLRNRGDALIFAAVVMIAGGVREEVQRGFILDRFGEYLGGAGWGVAIYSVFFGLGHWDQGTDAIIVTALLGAAWGVLYLVRRSIVAPLVCHAAFNLAQLLKYLAFAVR
ncbi:MAG: protease family protein [Acidobacteriota bacterium]